MPSIIKLKRLSSSEFIFILVSFISSTLFIQTLPNFSNIYNFERYTGAGGKVSGSWGYKYVFDCMPICVRFSWLISFNLLRCTNKSLICLSWGAISIDSKGLGSASSDAFILAISSSVKIFRSSQTFNNLSTFGFKFP